MTDVETLEERVSTVERAVSGGDHELPAVEELSSLVERVETVEAELAALEERTDELDAATQALRGYVGNVRSVNERVEQRADTALAATERLERRLDAVEHETESDASVDSGQSRGRSYDQPTETDRRSAPGGPESSEAATSGGTDGQSSESRETGVLEQIRSLL